MRIVHVITRLIVGGAQENTLLSCEGQHAAGHEVTLITGPALGPEGSLLDRARGTGYRVEVLDSMRRSVHPWRDWNACRQLTALLRAISPQVVHTHSSKAGILGRRAATAVKIPVVIHTIHGLAFTASRWRLINSIYKHQERRAARLSTRIVCVADAMRDQSLAAGIGRPEQYLTVYSGMETAPFLDPPVNRDESRRRLGIAPDDVVVGTIARLFDLKGHDDLLEAAPELCRQFAKLRFLWVGDGSLRRRFESRIAEMGLGERFILTGLVPPGKIPELTGAMDILVHPSRREGLARALPQGQLAGCPVITYDIDGNREGLRPRISGLLVKPFDVADFSAALVRLLEDAELRRTMGDAGRSFAASRFDARVMVDALEKLYEQELCRQG